MPLQLTNSFNPGDADPNGPYSQVMIVGHREDVKANYIEIYTEYGNTVAGKWVSSDLNGMPKTNTFTVMDQDEIQDTNGVVIQQATTDYSDYCGLVSSVAGENHRSAIGAWLYQWLMDNGHFTGTVVA